MWQYLRKNTFLSRGIFETISDDPPGNVELTTAVDRFGTNTSEDPPRPTCSAMNRYLHTFGKLGIRSNTGEYWCWAAQAEFLRERNSTCSPQSPFLATTKGAASAAARWEDQGVVHDTMTFFCRSTFCAQIHERPPQNPPRRQPWSTLFTTAMLAQNRGERGSNGGRTTQMNKHRNDGAPKPCSDRCMPLS